MTKLLAALVYTGLALMANPLAGVAADFAAVAALREGDMKKLVLHEAPQAIADVELVDLETGRIALPIMLANGWW